MANFLNNLGNFFSNAAATLQQYASQNIPLTSSNSVPVPFANDNYSLNRYSNDVREQTPEYQAAVLQKIKQDQTQNIIIAAVAGIALARLLTR